MSEPAAADSGPGPEISVIVTTYNKERELALVLEGYCHQSIADSDFELIVADDGSGPETARTVARARERTPVPIVHSWQEDDGFRAARSRNLAIARARGSIVVLTDGDCVPLPGFLEEQRRALERSCYLAGERYLLNEEEAAAVTVESIASGESFSAAGIPRREQKRVAKIRRRNVLYRALRLKVRPKVMTCNFVAWREDLLRINGFDERYVGWGHEDTDLGRRLRRLGVRSALALAPGQVLHLWHATESSFAGRVRDCANADYFHRGFFLNRCRKGILDRPFEDLSITVEASDAELKERAVKALGASESGSPELSVLFWGRDDAMRPWPAEAEIAVLVCEQGARLPSALLKQCALLLSQEKQEPREAWFKGQVERLEGESFDAAGLEEIRARLDAVI